ncbi:hypothetical protein [Adhaeretor mobilis]|uniref:Uncharacterized protein n=1 Tax=Adhaeretor mobilis TaxID=1930276 RepID=A0A517MY00_9BACT|nr:hypothetical protein [Adhaeretor mobilis]QDS99751.1 hypothetical protein HG15A2_30810 [Adhaeretor mobilis]
MPAGAQNLDREGRLQKIGCRYQELLAEIDEVDARVTAALEKLSPATSDDLSGRSC